MAGFIEAEAFKESKNLQAVWPLHYVDQMSRIFSGMPKAHFKTDVLVKADTVIEAVAGEVSYSFSASHPSKPNKFENSPCACHMQCYYVLLMLGAVCICRSQAWLRVRLHHE